jgi:hypothetical protein
VLAQLREPHRFPQLSALRQEILNWRFYRKGSGGVIDARSERSWRPAPCGSGNNQAEGVTLSSPR